MICPSRLPIPKHAIRTMPTILEFDILLYWMVHPIFMTMRIVYLSIQSTDVRAMHTAADQLRDERNLPVDFYALNFEQAEDDVLAYQELVRRTAVADFVYLRCMADVDRFSRFDRYAETLRKCPGLVM